MRALYVMQALQDTLPVCGTETDAAASLAPSNAAAHAGVAVLTNCVLWDTITDCMPGYPLAVRKCLDDQDGIASLERLEKDWAFRRQLEPSGLSRTGVLVHLAIAADDLQAFQIMCALRKRLAHYRHDPKLDICQAMRCAVLFSRTRILHCIAEMKAADPDYWMCEPHLLTLAVRNAKHTSVEVFDWIFAHAPREHNALVRVHMQQCARDGRLDLVQWLYERDCKLSRRAVRNAGMNGHQSVLEYLYAHTRARCRAAVINHVAASGNLELIQFLVAHDTKHRSRAAINSAAQRGHVAIVQFLIESKKIQLDTSCVIDFAAESGNLALVEYLHALYPDSGCTTQAMDSAAAFGHLEIVQFLHEHRSEGCSSRALDLPIRYGRLAIIEFLYERYPHLEVPPAAFEAAAANGHLDVLTFLHDRSLGSYSPNALNWAARRGRLAVVQFLCEHYPHLKVPSFVFDGAVANGHLDVVTFLHDHFPDSYTSNALSLAASHGHLDVLTFLHERYPELECSASVLDFAAANERLKVVQFLHDHFPSCYTPNALACAARRGRLDVVTFLCEHCSERDVTEALRTADLFGHHDVVAYLCVRLAGAAPSS